MYLSISVLDNLDNNLYEWFVRKLPLLSDEERETLIGRLITLKFIKSQSDSELQTASEFYDAENRLFQLMLEKEKFPPPPFDNYRWVCDSIMSFYCVIMQLSFLLLFITFII